MARGELFELGGNQGNDAEIADDGAGGAEAGTSHQAEVRLPAAASQAESVDPVTWASWSHGKQQNWRRKNMK